MVKVPLLLLPGLLCDAEVWKHQRHHLAGIADIIIPNLNHAASPQAMVHAALVDAQPYFALAGHSMGGWVALEIIKNVPERVLGLALLNTTAKPDNADKYAARKALIKQAEQGDYALIIDKLTKSFLYNTKPKSQVQSMLERNISALINQENAMLQRGDCLSVLASIKCPTLIIHSANDAVFNLDNSRLLAANIRHAKLVVVENCGHMSPLEAPLEISRHMQQWLETIRKFENGKVI